MTPNSSSSLFKDFRRLNRLWPFLRPQKSRVFLAASLIPIIAAMQASIPLLFRFTIDEGVVAKNKSTLLMGAAAYIGIIIFEYVIRGGQAIVAASVVHKMILNLRLTLISHILKLNCSYHDKALSGALVTRATSDFDNLSESLNMGVLNSIVDIAVLISVVIGMFLLDWRLALCAVAIFPFIALIVRNFSKSLKSAMLNARKKASELNGFSQECLYGNSTIKLLVGEDSANHKYSKLNIAYRDAQMKSVILDAWMFSILDGIASVTIGIILWLAISNYTNFDNLSAGLIVGFVQAIGQMFEPLKHLGNKIAMLQGAFTAIDRIFGILDQQKFIQGDQSFSITSGRVEFKNVSFAYDEGQQAILNDVSFVAEAGQSIAIVGTTGSGKSTIIKLISKLYDQYQGEILIDNTPLVNIDPHALRKQMAIVPQDIILFDGTLAFNLALGNKDISAETMYNAFEAMGATDFINSLPGKLEFKIREQGSNLSFGQRQVIAFARALVRSPKIIVLDEATSSIDPESERLIQTAVESILKDHTVFIIAHRLSTIEKCSRIIVIERGELVEQGNHSELMHKGARYRELRAQFSN